MSREDGSSCVVPPSVVIFSMAPLANWLPAVVEKTFLLGECRKHERVLCTSSVLTCLLGVSSCWNSMFHFSILLLGIFRLQPAGEHLTARSLAISSCRPSFGLLCVRGALSPRQQPCQAGPSLIALVGRRFVGRYPPKLCCTKS